jgi:hypothetical protein
MIRLKVCLWEDLRFERERDVRASNTSVRSGWLLPEPVMHPVATAGGGALLLAVFLAAVALPLATYTTALAMFGLAHVGSELRYVDHRFGGRLRGGLAVALGCGLAGTLVVRVLAMAGWLPYGGAIVLELTIVAAMTASTFVSMRRFRGAAAAVAALLFGCAVIAPVPTFLFLAVAHNLTPLAFLADALKGALEPIFLEKIRASGFDCPQIDEISRRAPSSTDPVTHEGGQDLAPYTVTCGNGKQFVVTLAPDGDTSRGAIAPLN